MHVSWREFLATPIEIVEDYRTVLEGEVLAAAPKGKNNISDALPGFDMETETELISYRAPEV